MKKIIIILTFIITSNTYGQIQELGQPESFNYSNNVSIPTLSYDFFESQIKPLNDSAYAIGVAEKVDINFFDISLLTTYSNGIETYQLKIYVNNILGVGLDFDHFYLPEDGKLFVYNEDKTILLGAYTINNNQIDRKFSIQPIAGQTIILEYNQPSNNSGIAIININRIAKIYRPIFGNSNTSQTKETTCFTDVHCVSGIEVERSVLKWRYYDTDDETYYICSCVLVNQDVLSNSLKPYILTANHCGKNAELSTAIFYFNFQNSFCGNNNAYQGHYTMIGGSKVSKRAVFDMFLIELSSFPPPDYNVHLSGWDRDDHGDLSSDMLGIHHPHGDEKNISLGTLKSNTNTNFWRVEWDRNDSPTHPGSSGSPLFDDDDDRIIGWLSYGTAECDKLDGIERYGKFKKAWTGLSSSKRLHDWLDPNGNDNNSIAGRDPCFTNLLISNRVFYSAQQLYQPENKVTVQAGNMIETNGNVIIESNSEYKFTAGTTIILKPGFTAEAGSNFIATIEACDQIAKILSIKPLSNDNSLSLPTKSITKTNNEVIIYPNPTTGNTTIEYSLQTPDVVSIDIYSINGTLMKNLLSNVNQNSGTFQIEFEATVFPKGVYICVLKTSNTLYNNKIVIQ